MQSIADQIAGLFAGLNKGSVRSIDKLPQSGSDREYFRLTTSDQTYIATYNLNKKENETFIAFSKHFKQQGCPVPEIYGINDDHTIYIQEDLGQTSLLDKLEQEGYTNDVYDLYKQSLAALAHMQIVGEQGLNYDLCLTAKEFGKQAILSDLLYFKYYFLDTLKQPYDKQALLDDFDALSNYLTHAGHKHFMFRDFQSRNIMTRNNGVVRAGYAIAAPPQETVHFIDYQGGMKGALQYDVASLLWQAKAELPEEWKNNLLEYYMDCVDQITGKLLDRSTFISQYNGYVLIRLLQVLGAYGFRGLFERKAHFLTSIPLALRNLKWFVQNKKTGIELNEFGRLLDFVVSDEVFNRFNAPKADDQTPLVVHINSFSYLKNGYPEGDPRNGGGFVFDMRGILNPGRIEEYKKLSGNDKPVQDFLEQHTRMNEFLNSIFDLVDITVENYMQRDFDSLTINFGCTGGQHRSVYAAEQTARHLRNKYKVKTVVHHINKENWVR